MIDEISIDRLILDIPGLDAAQARDLAHHVGEALAASASADTGAFSGANFDALAVDLNHPVSAGNMPRLADAIVRALLTQMGGR